MINPLIKKNSFYIFIFSALCLLFINPVLSCSKEKVDPSSDFNPQDFVRVKVQRVIKLPLADRQAVILTDLNEKNGMPIWIGHNEADAIFMELSGISSPTPLTHDLMYNIIRKAGMKIQRSAITALKDNVFFATITMEKDGKPFSMDARPSDSIILALKAKAPIYILKSIFMRVSQSLVGNRPVERAYGISLQELTRSLAEAFSYGRQYGILISDVRKGSKAEDDGLRHGDILAEIGGVKVSGIIAARDILSRGDGPLSAKIFRKGKYLHITIHR